MQEIPRKANMQTTSEVKTLGVSTTRLSQSAPISGVVLVINGIYYCVENPAILEGFSNDLLVSKRKWDAEREKGIKQ